MKKEQNQKNDRKRSGIQGDNVIQPSNQVRLPFLCVPVKDSFGKPQRKHVSEQTLYRVIKLK